MTRSFFAKLCKVWYKDSSRTQILNVNRPRNHPSTTKTRPQVKQARLPTKTAVALGPSYYNSVTKFSVKVKFTITGTEFGNCTRGLKSESHKNTWVLPTSLEIIDLRLNDYWGDSMKFLICNFSSHSMWHQASQVFVKVKHIPISLRELFFCCLLDVLIEWIDQAGGILFVPYNRSLRKGFVATLNFFSEWNSLNAFTEVFSSWVSKWCQ